MDIKIKELIYRKNSIMPKDTCSYFINLFEKHADKYLEESSEKYVKGKPVSHEKDNFKVLNLSILGKENKEIEQAKSLAFRFIEMMILNYTQFLKINVCPVINTKWWSTSSNIRVLRYNVGEQIKDHLDVNNKNRASCTINLNEDYEGGEFTFFSGKEEYVLKTGDSILFPAEPIFVHGTKKITKGTRYSINCFLHSKAYL
jgi:hypothetical protein